MQNFYPEEKMTDHINYNDAQVREGVFLFVAYNENLKHD